ncbi:hypothetical protein ISS39_00785 [Candidatus Bathyarchaeota archaeon]|nr:hypothetical protein [Candidatus Bathyarchaeota archaeon]
MPEMKYFIVYANWKPEIQGLDSVKEAMEKYTKVIEEAGCKVKLWGSALGVPETALIVIKGSPENYLKLLPLQAPYTNTRTHVVLTF